MRKRVLTIGILILCIAALTGAPGRAAPLLQARSVITYPADGTTVSGVVDVTGIATHPNMDFYQLRYAAGPQETGQSQWVDFAVVQDTQVENGVLASWDTTALPDGQYTLALAVWGVDDSANPYIFFSRRITVNNTQPVEAPTATPEPTQEQAPEEAPPTVPAGPSPTPMQVEQPATSTPRPTPTPDPSGEVVEVSTADDEETGAESLLAVFSLSEIRSAFCAGGTITLWLFLGWGGYLLVKAGVRWFMRRQDRSPDV
jgi:hypothetical protein